MHRAKGDRLLRASVVHVCDNGETPETIRCDKIVHRHAFWRQFTDINEDSLATYSKTCSKRPLKKKKKMVFKTDYRLLQVNIAECSKRAFCNTFDLH